MWKLVHLQMPLLAFLLSLNAVAQCSNGLVTIVEYRAIAYSTVFRLAGLEYDVKGSLHVAANGEFELTDLETFHPDGTAAIEGKDPVTSFPEAVKMAAGSWSLVNETFKEVSLPLFVEFRLAGDELFGDGSEQRNLVIMTSDKLLIRVIGKRGKVIVSAGEGNSRLK